MFRNLIRIFAPNYLINFDIMRSIVTNPTFRVGRGVQIKKLTLSKYNYIANNVKVSNVSLGSYSYIGEGSTLSNVIIGRFTSIGPGVKIGLGRHPIDFPLTHPKYYSNSRHFGKAFNIKNDFKEHLVTEVGDDVWIGANALVLSGVVIARGAIIAAGAIVTKDVPPNVIVAGVPARIIRERKVDELKSKHIMDAIEKKHI